MLTCIHTCLFFDTGPTSQSLHYSVNYQLPATRRRSYLTTFVQTYPPHRPIQVINVVGRLNQQNHNILLRSFTFQKTFVRASDQWRLVVLKPQRKKTATSFSSVCCTITAPPHPAGRKMEAEQAICSHCQIQSKMTCFAARCPDHRVLGAYNGGSLVISLSPSKIRGNCEKVKYFDAN